MSEYTEVKEIVQRVMELKSKKEYERALRCLLEAIEEYPKNNFLKNSLADLYYRMNHLGEALELLEGILKEDSSES